MSARHHLRRVRGVLTHAEVWAEVWGQGPPLVVVPGLGCASWMYRRLAGALAGRHTVWLYDPPGHGLSGRLRAPRIEHLTDQLAAWLDATGLAGSAVLGHSLGGEVAIDLAARYPAATGPLILCAPTGIPDNPSLTGQVARWALDIPRERPALWPLATAAYLRAAPGMPALAADQRRHRTGPLLPHVQAPTLILTGTRDPIIRAWTVDVLCRDLPDARSARLERGTHALTDHCPQEVADLVAAFLARAGSGHRPGQRTGASGAHPPLTADG